jgi:hypothetical protein
MYIKARHCTVATHVHMYKVPLLSLPQARQLCRIESVCPPGHPVPPDSVKDKKKNSPFLGLKQPERKTYDLPPSTADVSMSEAIRLNPLYAFTVWTRTTSRYIRIRTVQICFGLIYKCRHR